MKKVILVAALGILFLMCGNFVIAEENAEQLMKVDREFSQMSMEKGISFAFDFYMTDSVTILQDGSLPITGREAVNQVYGSFPKNAKLTWEPIFADIATSGDLGYTIGSWNYSIVDSTGAEKSANGHYITVWKKQTDGSWKYVFDTGTDGPKE